MGLAEKRVLQEFKDKNFINFQQQLQQVLGFEVPVEVLWDSMLAGIDGRGNEVHEWMEQIYFIPTLTVLKSIAADQMGKDAIKAKLTKILIDGTEGSNPSRSTFNDGVFHIQHQPCTNVDNTEDRISVWTELLEKSL